jgi:hypothetical protein
MSTERPAPALPDRRPDGWGQGRILRAPRLGYPPEAGDIARTLVDKYGAGALALARQRAARAVEIRDELALEAWRRVIEATKRLLQAAATPE